MSTQKTILDGIAFLPFPEQKDFLISELKDRFPALVMTGVPELVEGSPELQHQQGDLLYYLDKSSFLQASGGKYPYWARTCMTEPIILHFDSIGEAAGELKKLQRNGLMIQ